MNKMSAGPALSNATECKKLNVEFAIDDLEEALWLLGNAIGALAETAAPVLSPETPVDREQSNLGGGVSSATERILQAADCVKSRERAIRNIIDRL